MGLLPGERSVVLALAAVRGDQPGGQVATRDDGGFRRRIRVGSLPRSGGHCGFPPGPTDHDDRAGVSIDDNLVVGGIPVVLRLLATA